MGHLLELYDLPKDFPDLSGRTLNQQAEFAFNACLHLIPSAFLQHITGVGSFSSFKEELIMHITLNAFMVGASESEGSLMKKGVFLETVGHYFTSRIENKDKNFIDLFRGKELSDLSIRHFKDIGEYLSLKRSNNKKSFEISVLAAPFISFMANTYDAHLVLKSYKPSQQSKTFLQGTKEISGDLHFHFRNNFNYFLNSFQNINKIETHYNDSKISLHTTINKMLFEREYNLGLANNIAVLTQHMEQPERQKYELLLSLAALLPNIMGRLKYIMSIISSKKDMHDDLFLALINIALITIPVMEVYFLYLNEKSNQNLNDLKTIINEDNSYFKDKQSLPWINLSVTSYGLDIRNRIELHDFSFVRIKTILEIINAITETKKTELDNVFIDPQMYLDKYIDKFTSMSYGGNIHDITNLLSSTVKDNLINLKLK